MSRELLTITKTSPKSGDVVCRNAVFEVTFSQHLNIATINPKNFRIYNTGDSNAIVPVRVTWLPARLTVIIQPEEKLKSMWTYQLYVVGSLQDSGYKIRSISGTPLLTRYTVSFTTNTLINPSIPGVGDEGGNPPDWFDWEPEQAVGRIVLDHTGQTVASFTLKSSEHNPDGVIVPHYASGDPYQRTFVEDPIPDPSNSGCLYVYQTMPMSIDDLGADYISVGVDVYLSGDLPTDPSGIMIFYNSDETNGDIVLRHITPSGHVYTPGFEKDNYDWISFPGESGTIHEFYTEFIDDLKGYVRITNKDMLGEYTGSIRPSDNYVYSLSFEKKEISTGQENWAIVIHTTYDCYTHGFYQNDYFYEYHPDWCHLNYNNEYTIEVAALEGWGSRLCEEVTPYTFSFLTEGFPLYCSITIIRTALGSFIEDVEDHIIYRLINKASLEAITIYTKHKKNPFWDPHDLSTEIPEGIIEYTCCMVQIYLIEFVLLNYAKYGAGVSKRLGNFSVQRSESGPLTLAQIKLKDLKDCVMQAVYDMTWRGKAMTSVKAAYARTRPGTPWTYNRLRKNYKDLSPIEQQKFIDEYGLTGGPWEDSSYDNHTARKTPQRFSSRTKWYRRYPY